MVEPIKSIVLADTGDLFRKSMTEAINTEPDLRVIASTSDGPQLLEMIQQLHPDAVVMELVLSRMDGLEVLSALQELPAEQRPRVLVLSSYAALHVPCLPKNDGNVSVGIQRQCEKIINLFGLSSAPSSLPIHPELVRNLLTQGIHIPANLVVSDLGINLRGGIMP